MALYQGIYKKNDERFYKLSRSRIESFIQCKRCFFLDRKLKISHPQGFPFNLNSAVDKVLKNEFDYYRQKQAPHPYIKKLGLNAVPFQHEKLETWRENFKGLSYNHLNLKFHVFGALDDVWIDKTNNELMVVDYKSTSKKGEITLDADWQMGYKRQMEVYQYLLRKNGFEVSNTGYFVYCNGIRENYFEEKLSFKVNLISYTGSDHWIEQTLKEIYDLLNQDIIPDRSKNCDYCRYQEKLNLLKV